MKSAQKESASNLMKGAQIGLGISVAVFAVWWAVGFATSAWGSLPSASSGSTLSSASWNDVVGQVNSIAWAVSVDGTHLAATLPTASNHVATKAYVDAATGGGSYAGKTPTSYTGDLGGILGANAKCQAAFAGSHMCSANEIAKVGSAPIAAGWSRCEDIASISVGMTCDGFTTGASVGSFGTADCGGWTYSTAGGSPNWYDGGAFNGSSFTFSACSTSQPIHCCK